MVNLAIATCITIILFVFEVSAYPQRHNNYLLHDTRQDFKAGIGSSQSEIDLHPLKDFTALDPSQHQPSAPPEQGQLGHHYPHHQQNQQLEQEQQNFSALRELLFADETPNQIKTINFAHYPFANTPNLERVVNSNYENYEDIDDTYKQDAPEGNDNAHAWNGNESKDWYNQNTLWRKLRDEEILNDGQKRNAFHAIKRQKSKKHQSQFIPSISVGEFYGAMSNLGDFFDNLKNNIEFLEQKDLTPDQLQLLDGEHPVSNLKKELTSTSDEGDSSWNSVGPHGTAAFLHAIRTYRPSQRIRTLVSAVPDGYRGSNSLDPNYMWMGLGKRG